MKALIALAVLSAIVALYVVWLRPLMKTMTWGKAFLDYVEPVERVLWWKSETILWARLKIVSGLLLTALTQAGAIDITPLMPLVPEQYRGMAQVLWNLLPLALTIMGWVDERLRKATTVPLEVVGMRTDAPPEVKIAAAEAKVAADTAAQAAIDAKAV